MQGARASRTGAWPELVRGAWRRRARRVRRRPACGGWGVPVAESVLAPPGPIPNPVVTQRSAGEYCGGDPTGGEAAAGTPHPRTRPRTGQTRDQVGTAAAAGWSSGSSLGS